MEQIEFKGTKGEWTFNKSKKGNHYYINALDWDQFAKVVRRVEGVKDNQAKSNAKLIAAAPELLKALQMVTKAFDNKLIDSTLGNDFNVGGLLYTIDAAINKALK